MELSTLLYRKRLENCLLLLEKLKKASAENAEHIGRAMNGELEEEYKQQYEEVQQQLNELRKKILALHSESSTG